MIILPEGCQLAAGIYWLPLPYGENIGVYEFKRVNYETMRTPGCKFLNLSGVRYLFLYREQNQSYWFSWWKASHTRCFVALTHDERLSPKIRTDSRQFLLRKPEQAWIHFGQTSLREIFHLSSHLIFIRFPSWLFFYLIIYSFIYLFCCFFSVGQWRIKLQLHLWCEGIQKRWGLQAEYVFSVSPLVL